MGFLLQGLLPASLVGGAAGAVAAETLFGHAPGSELIMRMLVLAGMIAALLVTAVAVMVLTISVNRLAARLLQFTYQARPRSLQD